MADKLSAQEAYGAIMGIGAGDRPGDHSVEHNRGWDAGVAELRSALKRDDVSSPEQALAAVLEIPGIDAETGEHTDDYSEGWADAVSIGQDFAHRGLTGATEQATDREALAALYDAVERMFDANGTDPEEDPDAFKAAGELLGRRPRGGYKPAFTTKAGTYFMVVVLERNAERDAALSRESKRTIEEQLAHELREASDAGLVVVDFVVEQAGRGIMDRIEGQGGDMLSVVRALASGSSVDATKVVRQCLRALHGRSDEVMEQARESAAAFLRGEGN